MRMGRAMILLCAGLAGCAQPKPSISPAPVAFDRDIPPFASVPYEPFSRSDAIAIALREWRLFGQNVDDDPPNTRPDLGEAKPERLPGLWQRVGEYWWLGINAGDPTQLWTGRHDENGQAFPPARDGAYPWSAAFISYVMRIAGAGGLFPYAPAHHTYIDIAAEMAQGRTTGWAVRAMNPALVAPQPGDLICTGRGKARDLRFDDLPAGSYTAHCDIVVNDSDQGWAVIGGNVDDSVTLKHVPHDAAGHIAGPDGTSLDDRTPWMVVIAVDYRA